MTKGGRGRSSWIDYDALARVHDYILERAVTVHGSRWLPGEPLHIQDPTYDGARISGVRRRWVSLTPGERLRLSPGGGSALLAVQAGGRPFVDWASVLSRTSTHIRPATSQGSRTCTRT